MAPSLAVSLVALSKETMFYTYAHYKPDNSVFYIGKGSEESRKRNSEAQKNRAPASNETKQKLSDAVRKSWDARRLNAINKGNTQ